MATESAEEQRLELKCPGSFPLGLTHGLPLSIGWGVRFLFSCFPFPLWVLVLLGHFAFLFFTFTFSLTEHGLEVARDFQPWPLMLYKKVLCMWKHCPEHYFRGLTLWKRVFKDKAKMVFPMFISFQKSNYIFNKSNTKNLNTWLTLSKCFLEGLPFSIVFMHQVL